MTNDTISAHCSNQYEKKVKISKSDMDISLLFRYITEGVDSGKPEMHTMQNRKITWDSVSIASIERSTFIQRHRAASGIVKNTVSWRKYYEFSRYNKHN